MKLREFSLVILLITLKFWTKCVSLFHTITSITVFINDWAFHSSQLQPILIIHYIWMAILAAVLHQSNHLGSFVIVFGGQKRKRTIMQQFVSFMLTALILNQSSYYLFVHMMIFVKLNVHIINAFHDKCIVVHKCMSIIAHIFNFYYRIYLNITFPDALQNRELKDP